MADKQKYRLEFPAGRGAGVVVQGLGRFAAGEVREDVELHPDIAENLVRNSPLEVSASASKKRKSGDKRGKKKRKKDQKKRKD